MSENESKRWLFLEPGGFYAMGPIEAVSERAARAHIRTSWGVTSTRGWQFWEAPADYGHEPWRKAQQAEHERAAAANPHLTALDLA